MPRIFVLWMLFNLNFMLPKLPLFWLVRQQDSSYNSVGLSALQYSINYTERGLREEQVIMLGGIQQVSESAFELDLKEWMKIH